MRTKTAVLLVALGLTLTAATPASAEREECAGKVAAGCEYCSYYYDGMRAHPASKCDTGVSGYTWQDCTLYAGNRCVHGGEPQGRKCGFNSITDVTREAGWQTGEINAGPLVTGEPGTLHCTIVVNGNWHSSAAAADETQRDVGSVVVMARPLSYRATAADTVTLCTRWVPDSGPTLYWVGSAALPGPTAGWWSSSAAAPCSVFGPLDVNDPACGLWLAIDRRAGTNLAGVWQDCEGYEPII